MDPTEPTLTPAERYATLNDADAIKAIWPVPRCCLTCREIGLSLSKVYCSVKPADSN